MAKLEVGGITFTGGKMTAIIIALSSTIGVLYGAFEVYKDYMDMKEQIQSYIAPDMSHIEKQLAVLEERIIFVEDIEQKFREIDKSTTDTQRELRNDVYAIEKEVQDRLSESEKDVTGRLRLIDEDIRRIETSLNEKIEKILSNPLNSTE